MESAEFSNYLRACAITNVDKFTPTFVVNPAHITFDNNKRGCEIDMTTTHHFANLVTSGCVNLDRAKASLYIPRLIYWCNVR